MGTDSLEHQQSHRDTELGDHLPAEPKRAEKASDSGKTIDAQDFLEKLQQRDSENIFAANGRILLTGLLMGMRDLSEKGEVSLCEADVRDRIRPDRFIEMATREDISEESREAMQSFLKSTGWKPGVEDRSQWGDFDRQFRYAQGHALEILDSIMRHLSAQPERMESGYEMPSRRLSLLVEGRDYLKYREIFERLLFSEKLTTPQKDGKILELAMACLEEKMDTISSRTGNPFVKAESVAAR